jgi:hypothetical protein
MTFSDDYYAELYQRARAILRREQTEEFKLNNIIEIEGVEGGSLYLFYRDEHVTQRRGPRLLLLADKDGNIEQRGLGDEKALEDALSILRQATILDDLSEV